MWWTPVPPGLGNFASMRQKLNAELKDLEEHWKITNCHGPVKLLRASWKHAHTMRRAMQSLRPRRTLLGTMTRMSMRLPHKRMHSTLATNILLNRKAVLMLLLATAMHFLLPHQQRLPPHAPLRCLSPPPYGTPHKRLERTPPPLSRRAVH